MEIGGVTLDLGNVKVPIYNVAAREDHIAPAPSVFLGGTMYSGPVKFVVAGAGHIAGVVNPPARDKYQYWTKGTGDTYDDWIASATETPGSWWPDWHQWLTKQSGGKMVPAREPGCGKLDPIEDAPGSYVLVRCDE